MSKSEEQKVLAIELCASVRDDDRLPMIFGATPDATWPVEALLSALALACREMDRRELRGRYA